jgi:hypothetical protein
MAYIVLTSTNRYVKSTEISRHYNRVSESKFITTLTYVLLDFLVLEVYIFISKSIYQIWRRLVDIKSENLT